MWWNNKNRPQGAGTCSRARAERFKQKGYEDRMRREWERTEMNKNDKVPLAFDLEGAGKPPPAPLIKGEKDEKKYPCPLWGKTNFKIWKVVKKEEKKEEEKKVGEKESLGNRNKKPGGPRVTFSLDTEKEMEEEKTPLVKGLEFGPSPAELKKTSTGIIGWDDTDTDESFGVEEPPAKKTKEEEKSSSSSSHATLDKREHPDVTLDKREKHSFNKSSLDKRERHSFYHSSHRKREEWQRTGHQRWVLKEKPDHTAEKEPMDVAVDWYNVIWVGKRIPDESLKALRKLRNHGCNVHMLSFSGWEREQEVREELKTMGFWFDSVNFVREKVGPNGKVDFMKKKGWGILFDDSYPILQECHKEGVYCYAIATWANRNYQHHRYDDLEDAVDHFLEHHNLDER